MNSKHACPECRISTPDNVGTLIEGGKCMPDAHPIWGYMCTNNSDHFFPIIDGEEPWYM
jgi:hypothetical protein